MSAILKTFGETFYKAQDRPTYWLILECGHWYHWTSVPAPKDDTDIICPRCRPIMVTTHPPQQAGG